MGATLTQEQEAVANHVDGHALVTAVAGSGKTTTLVERVGRLVDGGVDAPAILCLMFNRSARKVFERKLRDRLKRHTISEVRTYHSMGFRMCSRLVQVGAMAPAELVKSPAKLEQAARQALQNSWRRSHGKDSYPPQEAMDGFLSFMTQVKSAMQPAEEVFDKGNYSPELRVMVDAFAEFESTAIAAKKMYYDDLIYRTMMTMRERPELWSLFSNYEHIMVDEFQDTNAAQFEMVSGLASGGASVMVVGDDDQAIYSWRGSDVRFILETFAEEFVPCTSYPLTITFRYGHETCLAASHVITRNTLRTDKLPVAHPGNPDTRIHIVERIDAADSGVVPYLERLQQKKRLMNSAMLVRYYSQSVPTEMELLLAGIPYHVYGREPLLYLPEIGAMVAAMSIATDYWTIDPDLRDRFYEALLRCPTLYLERPIITSLAKRMRACFERSPVSIIDPILEMAQNAERNKRNTESMRLRSRADLLRVLASQALANHSPSTILGTFLSMTNLLDVVARQASTVEAGQEAKANIQAFVDMASSCDDTSSFLDTLGPLAAHKESNPPSTDHLAIMSMHRSKGLEFDTVFLPGWTLGSFPREGEELEEERRLAYVAITRAIQNLVFLVPSDAGFREWVRDTTALPKAGVSRLCSNFLFDAEIGACRRVAQSLRIDGLEPIEVRDPRVPARYLKLVGRGPDIKGIAGGVNVRALYALTPSSKIHVGMEVSHEKHGLCVVERPLYGPVWMLRRHEDGGQFHDVVAGNNWFALSPAG